MEESTEISRTEFSKEETVDIDALFDKFHDKYLAAKANCGVDPKEIDVVVTLTTTLVGALFTYLMHKNYVVSYASFKQAVTNISAEFQPRH